VLLRKHTIRTKVPASMSTADPTLILALDATSARCSAALWNGHAVTANAEREGPTGEAALLPGMVADLLASQSIGVKALVAIAVAIGPGSFTGLRASLALAQGLALGAGVPVIGVTVAEALAMALPADERPIWCALDARQGRLFLHRPGPPDAWEVVMLETPPTPDGAVVLTGDAAEALSLRLQESGIDATASAARQPHARGVAMAASLRLRGALPPLDAAPLYIDPPRALLPRGGLRPPPRTAGPP